MEIWQTLESLGTVAAAGIAAYAAYQARVSSAQANSAATKLANIESQRRHSELCPQFRVSVAPLNPGLETLRLHVMLIGPSGLDRLDHLTAIIRDDHFQRGEGSHVQYMGGPTKDDIRNQIWGPYRFKQGTAPDGAQADSTGRVTEYQAELPIGEELLFQLQPTLPPPWDRGATNESWRKQVGSLLRLALVANHRQHGKWYLACELDTAKLSEPIYVPQSRHSGHPGGGNE